MSQQLEKYIRTIPDFPQKGILFRDITTLLKNPQAMREAFDFIVKQFENIKIDKVVGIESRGFIFGGLLANKFNCGFVPARKPNKLPFETVTESYSLEYGTNTLELHKDAIESGENVLIHDDVLATGGTAKAVCNLVEKLGGKIIGISFLIELTFLNGRELLKDYEIQSLVKY